MDTEEERMKKPVLKDRVKLVRGVVEVVSYMRAQCPSLS